MNDVIVIGSDHHNTLGVVESLGMAGLLPYVIIETSQPASQCFVMKSKYCRGRGLTATCDQLVSVLHEHFDHGSSEKAVVIPTNDRVASMLDNHLLELSGFLLLPGTGKQGELEYWMNKLNMIQLAEEMGMNVPKTITVKRGNTVDEFVFPCITKSVSSLEGGKSNVRICRNRDELNSFLSDQKNYSEIQVQQLIDKDFEFQLLGCSLAGGEEIVVPGRTHIVRPNGFDNLFHKAFVQFDESFDEVLSQAKEFIRQTHYSGLFSMEFIRDKSGTDYFLEMNFRNDGAGICATASGTNLPYIWYLSKTDERGCDSELSNPSFKPVVFTPMVQYFYNMAEGEVPFGEWWRNNVKTTQFSTYFKGDTAPFWYQLRKERRHILSALGHKLFHRSSR